MPFEPWYNHHGWPGAQSPSIKSFPGLFWWVHNNNAPIYRRPGFHSFISEVKVVVPFTESFGKTHPIPLVLRRHNMRSPTRPPSCIQVLRSKFWRQMTNIWQTIQQSLQVSVNLGSTSTTAWRRATNFPRHLFAVVVFSHFPLALWKPAFPDALATHKTLLANGAEAGSTDDDELMLNVLRYQLTY